MPDAPPENVSAVIVAGGDPIDAAVVERLPVPCYVIAADSGLDHAVAVGLRPDVVIGDMDSVNATALAGAMTSGVHVLEHPRDKDATDLELALDHARVRGHTHAVLLGGYGGRLSHLLGNALVLAAAGFAAMRIEWHAAATTVHVVRPTTPLLIQGGTGDLVSLLAVGGDAAGVTTSGLRWRLSGETLAPGSTRGMSNLMTGERASAELTHGCLLAIHERNEPS